MKKFESFTITVLDDNKNKTFYVTVDLSKIGNHTAYWCAEQMVEEYLKEKRL